MKDYLRCVYANKISFACFVFSTLMFGLALAGSTKILPMPASSPMALSFFGVVSCCINTLTNFGLETYHTYRRVEKIIQRGETERLANVKAHSYCEKVGLDLAKQKANISIK